MPSEVTTVGSEQSAEKLRRQLAEALETQTATAAILRVIASSPGDLTPVLSAVAESAARLCDAFDALVLLRKGDELHTLAHHGPIPAHPGGPIARDWVIGRAFLDRTPLQVADLTTAGADFPRGQAMAVRDGFRTSLAIHCRGKRVNRSASFASAAPKCDHSLKSKSVCSRLSPTRP